MTVEKKVICDRCGCPVKDNGGMSGTWDLCVSCLVDFRQWIQDGVK